MGAVVLGGARERVRIRVMEVLATLRRAGAERMAVSLARGLDPARFETEVISLFDPFPGGLDPELAAGGIGTRHLGKRSGFDPRMYPRLARAFRAFAPAVVHTHSYVMRYAWPARITAGGGAMVHTVHNVATREVEWLGRMIHRAAFTRGVAAVAVGGEVARSFREYYGAEPAAVIANGVDLARFRGAAGARNDWKRAQGFTERDRLVVSVARLEPQKNPLGLIEAFSRAFAGEPDWHLVLAGDGSLRESARGLAGRLGLGGRVRFLGVRDDVPELLAAGDLFALAAGWEGSPVAVIEAMAAGLPVAATAVGGVSELVEHGATGLLSAAGDTAALADSFAALARDPERRAEFGARARARAERYGVERMVEAYAELFERVARGRP